MPTVLLRIKSVIPVPSFKASIQFGRFFATLGSLVSSKATDDPYLLSSESHPFPESVNTEGPKCLHGSERKLLREGQINK